MSNVFAVLKQISTQLLELEERLVTIESKIERPKLLDLVMPDVADSEESDSESSDGYESAPATFQYKES